MGKYVRGYGSMDARVVLLGEAPATEECKVGRPFVGKSGAELDWQYLPLCGLDRDAIRIENVFEWQIPIKAHEKDRYLREHLEKQTQDVMQRLAKLQNMEVLVTLGGVATSLFLDKGMDMVHGLPHTKIVDLWHEMNILVVFPCYHPAAGLHSPDAIRETREDFAALGHYLQHGGRVWPLQQQAKQYNIWEWGNIHADTGVIAIDTEWSIDGKTWCFTVAEYPDIAWLVWPDDMADWYDILHDSLVIFHNAVVDLPRLWEVGIYPQRYIDTMIMAYHVGQPQGLKTLGYRLLGAQMQKYTDVVKDATDERCVAYMQKLLQRTWDDPDPVREWRTDAKMEWTYRDVVKSCTKRKKGAMECNHQGLAAENCPACEGKGYYFIDKKRDKQVPVAGTENGYWHHKFPRNIGPKVETALSKFANDPNYDLLGFWQGTDGTDAVEAVQGKLQMADLGMVGLGKATQYACMDADTTLQIAPHLLRKYREYGMEVPEWMDILEDICITQ
jgi:uracil-DNA glycosylase family 4